MIDALRTFRVRPSLPSALEPLAELAENLRWAWDRRTRELFRRADPVSWSETGENPVAVLGRLSTARLDSLVADDEFMRELTAVHEDLRRYLRAPSPARADGSTPPSVAYFSPEFGISHVVQTYSGGLGVLAGDHLKASSDLRVPMVGVGLLYRHGYFRQLLDAEGWQHERYPDLNPHGLPLARLERDGEPACLHVRLADREVACQVWLARVGRVPLLLIDADLPENAPDDRTVTDKLYGGDREHRLRQEILLGIGGVRALDVAADVGAVDVGPDLYHSNEGHAGFLQLERIRRLVASEGLSFDEAVEASRASVLFTTHTPVPAGIDRFPRWLIERYFTDFAHDCGVDVARLMAVGQADPGHSDDEFNMAVMGLRLSARANGVSQLHGVVARRMFASLWPDLASEEVPIDAITNGVHADTWVGPEAARTFDRHLPPDWPHDSEAWRAVGGIGDDELWDFRQRARERLVTEVRGWVRAQHERRGRHPASLGWTDELFDPDALTIGFARRFAEYKRGTLLLSRPERLRALLGSRERPVQVVFSGKAHPHDDHGKDLIRQLVRFSEDPDMRSRVVFVEDYDMAIARSLYAGVDVWLNTPRRPFEACGTSGQKAVLNGAVHCSTLDGWWDEMYDGTNGFAVGGGEEPDDPDRQDVADAEALFDVLERVIVPTFFDRADGAAPHRWLAIVRRSLETLGGAVLASRMVEEYVSGLYTPIAQRAARLQGDHRRPARALAEWRTQVQARWDLVEFGAVEVDETVATLGAEREVAAQVRLGDLEPTAVRVEVLHGPVDADGDLRHHAVTALEHAGRHGDGWHGFRGRFRTEAAGEYGLAVRVVPSHPDLTTPLELGRATWAGADRG